MTTRRSSLIGKRSAASPPSLKRKKGTTSTPKTPISAVAARPLAHLARSGKLALRSLHQREGPPPAHGSSQLQLTKRSLSKNHSSSPHSQHGHSPPRHTSRPPTLSLATASMYPLSPPPSHVAKPSSAKSTPTSQRLSQRAPAHVSTSPAPPAPARPPPSAKSFPSSSTWYSSKNSTISHSSRSTG